MATIDSVVVSFVGFLSVEEEAYEEVEEEAPKDEAEIQVGEPMNGPHQFRFLRLESFFCSKSVPFGRSFILFNVLIHFV